MIDNVKMYKIIQYIKQTEFEFEVPEVLEDLDSVLAYYNLMDIDLTEDEKTLLMIELTPLAEQFEFSEVAHLALQEEMIV